jgi:hypothetical protein
MFESFGDIRARVSWIVDGGSNFAARCLIGERLFVLTDVELICINVFSGGVFWRRRIDEHWCPAPNCVFRQYSNVLEVVDPDEGYSCAAFFDSGEEPDLALVGAASDVPDGAVVEELEVVDNSGDEIFCYLHGVLVWRYTPVGHPKCDSLPEIVMPGSVTVFCSDYSIVSVVMEGEK